MLAAQQKEKKRIRNKERKCERTRKEREKKEKNRRMGFNLNYEESPKRLALYRPRIHYIEW